MANFFATYPGGGGGGGGGTVTWANQAPVGAINNANLIFTIASAPVDTATLEVFQDGLLLYPGVDYNFAGTTITMTVAPNFGQTLWAYYRSV